VAEIKKAGSSLMTGAALMIVVILVAQVLQPMLPTLYVIFVVGLIIWFVGRR
jgi:hypothetical protein